MPFDAINYQGKNFVPVKPLKEAKALAKSKDDKNNPSSINAFFREQWQGLWREHDTAWREVIKQGEVISNLRSAKLTMKQDLSGTGYVFLKPLSSSTGGRDRSNYPLFPQNSEILTAKWQRARPSVRSRSFGDGYKTSLQLDLVDTVVNSYFRDIFTSIYETREAYSAQDYGTYITQFEYDDTLNQIIKIAPVVQQQSKVLVDGYGACYDCGFEGKPQDFQQTGAPMPQCPQCESFRTTRMIDDAVADESFVSDVEAVSQGDIRGRLLDFPACRYDPRVFAHESDYFLYSERVPLRLIHKMFGEDLEIDGDDTNDIGLQVMDALAHRGGNIHQWGENNLHSYESYDRFTEEGVLRNMWLKPSMYAGFKLKKSEQTLAGRIPANIPFEEIFPEGLCVRGFNDMRMQVGLYAEKANIASGVFLYQSHSGIGKGISDGVDIAKDLNEGYSMALAGLKRYGASGLAVAANSGITQENVRNLFKPQKAVFVELDNIAGGNINNAIMQVQPNPVNPALATMMEHQANMLGLAFMTGDFSQGGVNDVDINTFGGQQLAAAKAEEQKGAIFTRKAFHREMSASIICDIFRKHIKFPIYYAHDEDNHSTVRGKMISGADLPERIKFDAVPESEISENKFEKRMAAQEMIEKAGGLPMFAQAAQLDPKMTAWYTGLYGVSMPTLDEKEIKTVCMARLTNIQELSQMFPDPEQILASLDKPLNVREASHMLKSEFLQQILDDDQVSSWNPVARETVNLLIERHYELEAEAQFRNANMAQMVQQKLMAQQVQAEQSMMQPQMDQQQQMMQDEQEMGMIQELGARVLDDEQAQVDVEREEESKNTDFQRSEEAADRQQKRNLELEKAKAANKPAPKKPAARGK